MTTPVVMARDEEVTLYRDSRGILSACERGPLGERNKVVALGIVFEPVCSCCDRVLDYEERRNAPQMYTDALCKTCFQWIGRVLVKWLGTDDSVASLDSFEELLDQGRDSLVVVEDPDPFWIDTNEWGA